MDKNPNETILVPMLNRRVADLTVTNILLEARLTWEESEKKRLTEELFQEQEKHSALQQGQADHQAAIAAAEERGRQSALVAWETEKSALLCSFEDQKRDLNASIANAVADVKRASSMDIGFANAQRDEIGRECEALRVRIAELESRAEHLSAAKAERDLLATENAELQSRVAKLQAEVDSLTQPAQVIAPKKRGKKVAVMGGDTY
jgi:chromosome segregation ATPase